jgi:hypothetical protein
MKYEIFVVSRPAPDRGAPTVEIWEGDGSLDIVAVARTLNEIESGNAKAMIALLNAASLAVKDGALNDPAKLAACIASIKNFAKPGACKSVINPRRGAPGRQVRVIGLIEGEAPSGFSHGMLFDTAAEASTALGFNYNSISILLAKAKKAGDTSVIVKGVELQYLEDTPGRVD